MVNVAVLGYGTVGSGVAEILWKNQSHVNRRAGEEITQGCIVLEGGALLGLYTAGVLDGLMLMGINMQTTIGVSAGAMFGMGYVSGQIGREAKFNLSNRFNQRYIGAGAEFYDHSFFSLPYLFDDSHYDEPFDAERFYKPERRFLAVATDCNTGQPAFLAILKAPSLKGRSGTSSVLFSLPSG